MTAFSLIEEIKKCILQLALFCAIICVWHGTHLHDHIYSLKYFVSITSEWWFLRTHRTFEMISITITASAEIKNHETDFLSLWVRGKNLWKRQQINTLRFISFEIVFNALKRKKLNTNLWRSIGFTMNRNQQLPLLFTTVKTRRITKTRWKSFNLLVRCLFAR